MKPPFVRIAFPAGDGRALRASNTRWKSVAIYPGLPGIEADPRYDGFRRSFLNIFQVNPRVQMLANNASSDPVPFTVYMNALVAAAAPPLAPGLTAMDLVRMTVDRYLAGAKGYGLVGYAAMPGDADLVAWKAPWNSLDTYPSLLIRPASTPWKRRDLAWAQGQLRQARRVGPGDDGRRQERRRPDRIPAHRQLRRPGHGRQAAVQLVGHDQLRP